jgi:hypothetical protein
MILQPATPKSEENAGGGGDDGRKVMTIAHMALGHVS